MRLRRESVGRPEARSFVRSNTPPPTPAAARRLPPALTRRAARQTECARDCRSGRSDFAERRPQNVHARHDAELRDQGEREHQAEQNVTRSEHMRSSVGEAAVEQRTDQENDSRDQWRSNATCPERARPRCRQDACLAARRNCECRGRQDESKKDQPADPDDERKQHEKTQEGHDARIICSRGIVSLKS